VGIDLDLDLWKYFFHVWCPQDPKVELMIFWGAIIHVKSGHGVDPYLEMPMLKAMKGWRKKWFYLKNDDSAPLLVFTNGQPVPLPSWGEGAAGKDHGKIQPLCEYLQQLWQEGSTEIHLLRTFFSGQIQPLWKQRTKMWVYSGSSCPDHPSLEELIAVEVEARIRKILDFAVIPSPRTGPDPLRRGITSVKVSTLGPISTAFAIMSFHCARDLAQGLRGGHGESQDADLPMNASGWEARHASNGATWAREERERHRHAASQAVKKCGT
jgi:hypothetical protein